MYRQGLSKFLFFFVAKQHLNLTGQIVEMMKKKGYLKFTINQHTDLWKCRDAKKNSQFGTLVAGKWHWYQTWVDEVEKLLS